MKKRKLFLVLFFCIFLASMRVEAADENNFVEEDAIIGGEEADGTEGTFNMDESSNTNNTDAASNTTNNDTGHGNLEDTGNEKNRTTDDLPSTPKKKRTPKSQTEKKIFSTPKEDANSEQTKNEGVSVNEILEQKTSQSANEIDQKNNTEQNTSQQTSRVTNQETNLGNNSKYDLETNYEENRTNYSNTSRKADQGVDQAVIQKEDTGSINSWIIIVSFAVVIALIAFYRLFRQLDFSML